MSTYPEVGWDVNLVSRDKRFEFLKNNIEDDCYVSRCRPLGLTAYGKTQEEATSKLIEMFKRLVHITIAIGGK